MLLMQLEQLLGCPMKSAFQMAFEQLLIYLAAETLPVHLELPDI
jgi:hypothetical protein